MNTKAFMIGWACALVAFVLLAPAPTHAFDGKRTGFVLGVGGGVGFGAVSAAETILDPRVRDSGIGPALLFTLGWGLTESDWLALEGNLVTRTSNAWEGDLEQGFAGVIWYHAFGDRGPGWVACIGTGRYLMRSAGSGHICISINGPPCPDEAPSARGPGVLVGAGRRLTPRLTLMARSSVAWAKDVTPTVVVAGGSSTVVQRSYQLFHLNLLLEYLWD